MSNRLPRCSICKHAHRARMDFLCATGPSIAAVARRFEVSPDALERHFRNHVTDGFKKAARIGPFSSEEELRRLAAEEGVSLLENARAVHAGLVATYLAAVEAASPMQVAALARALHENISLRGRLAGELAPGGMSVTINNNIAATDFLTDFGRDLIELVRRHPAIKADVVGLLRRRMGVDEPLIIGETSDAA